jgi:hypothetical protein
MTRFDTELGGSDHATSLRAILSASVSDACLPADLLDRAIRRNNRRTIRNGLAGAVAVAGMLATVIATGVGGAAGHPASAVSGVRPHVQRTAKHPQVLTVAYVVDHVATALTNSYRMISVDQSSGGLDHGSITYTDMATQQQHYVGGLRDSSGQPYLQSTTSISKDIWTEFDVDYADQVYSTLTMSDIDHGQQVTVSSWLPLQFNADPAVAFRQALKAHQITVAGHRVLDGRNTILLRVNGPSDGWPQDPQDPSSWIWVDASTYLVVQTEHFIHAYKGGTPIPPTPTSKLMWIAIFNRVTWLAPTPQNLALLTLNPPTGFTNVPYSVMTSYLGRIS